MAKCKSCGEKLEGGILGFGSRCQNTSCTDYYVNNMGMNGIGGENIKASSVKEQPYYFGEASDKNNAKAKEILNSETYAISGSCDCMSGEASGKNNAKTKEFLNSEVCDILDSFDSFDCMSGDDKLFTPYQTLNVDNDEISLCQYIKKQIYEQNDNIFHVSVNVKYTPLDVKKVVVVTFSIEETDELFHINVSYNSELSRNRIEALENLIWEINLKIELETKQYGDIK